MLGAIGFVKQVVRQTTELVYDHVCAVPREHQNYRSSISDDFNLPIVYCIRHAQSQTNNGEVEAYLYGDPTLSCAGEKEADTLFKTFNSWNDPVTDPPPKSDALCNGTSANHDSAPKLDVVNEPETKTDIPSLHEAPATPVANVEPLVSSGGAVEHFQDSSSLDDVSCSTSMTPSPSSSTSPPEPMELVASSDDVSNHSPNLSPQKSPPSSNSSSSSSLDCLDVSQSPMSNPSSDSSSSPDSSRSSAPDSSSSEDELAEQRSDFGWLTDHNVTTIMISPLRRALRTAFVVFDIERGKKSPHFPMSEIVLDLREAVFSRADLGSYRSALQIEFPFFRAELSAALPEGKWWLNTWALPMRQLSHSEIDISARLKSFSDHLLSKQYEGQVIAIVGHSQFFKLFLDSPTKLKNCGVVRAEFNVTSGRWEAKSSLPNSPFADSFHS